jgi:hypothetical protein
MFRRTAKTLTFNLAKRNQYKRLFFSKIFSSKAVRDNLAGTDTLSIIKGLVYINPQDALRAIENGWQSGKIPFNEQYLKEYFKAAASLKKLDSVNIEAMLTMLKTSSNPDSKAGMSSNIAAILNANRSLTAAGATPTEPMYVATVKAVRCI